MYVIRFFESKLQYSTCTTRRIKCSYTIGQHLCKIISKNHRRLLHRAALGQQSDRRFIVLGLGRHPQPRYIKSSSTTYKPWRLTRKVIEAYVLFSFRSEKPDVPQFRSVHEWLKFINMDKYSEVFKAANIKSLQKVIRLDDTKLKGMGITLIGHRNKMLKSIRSMKSQFVNRALDDDEAAIQWCLLYVGFKGAMSCGYCCFRSIPY